MKRRQAVKLAIGLGAGGGLAGYFAFSAACKPKTAVENPQILAGLKTTSTWAYRELDPAVTAERAYQAYDTGSCMYGVFSSVLSQLAEKYGEPFTSFPLAMMKYGHGGIGGFGTVCGALNGAAALLGLFVQDKKTCDLLITDLFRWYEDSPLPSFTPQKPIVQGALPVSVSQSTLCHISIANWLKTAGGKINSKERKERCRRLTADTAAQTVAVANRFFAGQYSAPAKSSPAVAACLTCHGDQGKIGNVSARANCASCHTESLGHKIFANTHYKFMKDKGQKRAPH